MAVAYVVPLLPNPQMLQVQFSGVTYNLRLTYNATGGYWIIDIYDENQNALVLGIAMVTGVDLLAQFEYIGIPGKLVCQTSNDTDIVPTFSNLGSEANLYYVV